MVGTERQRAHPANSQSIETCFMVSPKVRHALPFETVLAHKLLMLDRTSKNDAAEVDD